MQQREKFSSRLGFILISAGCAIGLGNVYRFPIITGAYGGAIFVLIYIGFLLLLGLPIMTVDTDGMELYDKGEEKAWLELFYVFTGEKEEVIPGRIGILGMTPQELTEEEG